VGRVPDASRCGSPPTPAHTSSRLSAAMPAVRGSASSAPLPGGPATPFEGDETERRPAADGWHDIHLPARIAPTTPSA
jgi:hypothetical protein